MPESEWISCDIKTAADNVGKRLEQRALLSRWTHSRKSQIEPYKCRCRRRFRHRLKYVSISWTSSVLTDKSLLTLVVSTEGRLQRRRPVGRTWLVYNCESHVIVRLFHIIKAGCCCYYYYCCYYYEYHHLIPYFFNYVLLYHLVIITYVLN